MTRDKAKISTAEKKRAMLIHSKAMGKEYPCRRCRTKGWDTCSQAKDCEEYRAWFSKRWKDLQNTLLR